MKEYFTSIIDGVLQQFILIFILTSVTIKRRKEKLWPFHNSVVFYTPKLNQRWTFVFLLLYFHFVCCHSCKNIQVVFLIIIFFVFWRLIYLDPINKSSKKRNVTRQFCLVKVSTYNFIYVNRIYLEGCIYLLSILFSVL